MDNLIEVKVDNGGIYVILNVLECKAYVGQTKDFSKRTHISELEHGIDNSNLQDDFDNIDKEREFVYFVVVDAGNKPEKRILDTYEKLYMTLMEDLGFYLYNDILKREDRTIEKLNIDKEEYDRAKKTLIQDFIIHFDIEPNELIESCLSRRQQALEYYANNRLNLHNKKSDRFLFSRTRINNILGNEVKSLNSIDISEMFFSKAGNYVGEGLDQILNYKIKSINKYGYCLWAFANNAVHTETVRACCRDREAQEKDAYVLFKFTPSSEYASNFSYEHSCLTKSSVKCLNAKDLKFLKLKQEHNGRYTVPKEIVCTASNHSSADAFVLQEMFLIKEDIDEDELKKQYLAVGKHGMYDIRPNKRRSTFYIQAKNNIDVNKLYVEAKHRTISFIGKLAPPYIITITPSKII